MDLCACVLYVVAHAFLIPNVLSLSSSQVVGEDIAPNSSTTLNKMIALKLEPFMEQLEAVSGAASKEFSLEKAMNRMEDEWKPMEFGSAS